MLTPGAVDATSVGSNGMGHWSAKTSPCHSSAPVALTEVGLKLISETRNPARTSLPSDAEAPPPAVVVATATAGLVPPVRELVAVIWGTSSPMYWPPNVTTIAVPGWGPPATATSPTATLDRASSAVFTWAAVALYGIAAVV